MLRASSHRYQGTSIMTHRQLLASLLLFATAAAPAQAAVTDASLDAATAELESVKARQADAAKHVDRWKEESEFSRK